MILIRLYMLAVIGFLIYITDPGSSLFSWHPTFMTIGSMIILYEGVLIMVPNRGLLINGTSQNTKRNTHSILQIIGFLLIFTGFTSVAMAKERAKIPHFNSLHSLFGGIAGVLLGFQIAAGLATRFQRLSPIPPKYLKFGHIVLGLLQYSACCLALMAGMHTDYITARTTPFIRTVLTVLPMIAFGTSFTTIINKFLEIFLKPKCIQSK
uniref:ascorbate ferrireductase (transmembrane) n=1 Tax=Strigamia maritima TaxID=126957 RepID=T1JFL3_STRMM